MTDSFILCTVGCVCIGISAGVMVGIGVWLCCAGLHAGMK